MLIVALGTIASGSTWAFNVIRALLAESCPSAVSLSTAEASGLLSNIPNGCQDVLVKTHHVDAEMLALISLFKANIVVTTRDPRDSLVSQRERFGATLHDAVRDLSRSAATLSMLDSETSVLRLRYEDRFMDDPATIERIASFLGLETAKAHFKRIFEQFRPETVTRNVDRLLGRGRLRIHGFDPASHWHPGHVGDGECGKWKQRLPTDDQDAVMGAVGGDLEQAGAPESIEWSAKLFDYVDGRQGGASEILDCEGEERALTWGPYQYLPTGRWQVSPLVRLIDQDHPVTIKIDVFIPVPGREVLALRMVNLPSSSSDRMVMEFDHHDHLQPVELRVSAVADGRQGRIEFCGATLKWLGPSERPSQLAARSVVEV